MARYLGSFFADLGVMCRQLFDGLWSVLGPLLELLIAFLGVIWSFLMAAWENPEIIKTAILNEELFPFYAIYLNIILSILLCFVVRKIGAYLFRKNEYRVMVFNQCVLAVQVSMCAYGESAIFEKYGFLAYFISTGINMTIAELVNGRLMNMLLIAEEFGNGFVTESDVVYGIALPFAACVPCFWFGAVIFGFTQEFITGMSVNPADCANWMRIPIQLSFLVEMLGAFVFRIFMTQLDRPGGPVRLIPWVYAAFFTFDRYILGVPGLHLAVTFARFAPCSGVVEDERKVVGALAVYVVAICLGWFLSYKVPKGQTAMRSIWRLRQEKLQKDGKGEIPAVEPLVREQRQQPNRKPYGRRRR
ncbi:hypothetical protein CAEBREN_02141 [Caenorhabditis brenneri]|uniref:Uncharacterized protein n=1 Tax=Caenorhabditis brenneri TaxID=135651 RepID=G0N3D6_CAEBE|nr:hypothetical protein CAEBREN_02141 [Caenorhabditis brenneri]